MLGAIVGDIVGSRFERQNYKGIEHAHKSKEFELFTEESTYTDDTICTCAIAKAIMAGIPPGIPREVNPFAYWMHRIGGKYLDRGFGGQFTEWLKEEGPTFPLPPPPFGSWGNGSAMRVSPVGWINGTVHYMLGVAKRTAEATHNHPDAIKGARAVAHAIWLARQKGMSKQMIREMMWIEYYPELKEASLDTMRPGYEFTTKCSETVPVALQAFFEGCDFEDCLRNAISMGGDSDTLAAITGSVAHSFYGAIPTHILRESLSRLSSDLCRITQDFCGMFANAMNSPRHLEALQLPDWV